jgi:hypothetical protein
MLCSGHIKLDLDGSVRVTNLRKDVHNPYLKKCNREDSRASYRYKTRADWPKEHQFLLELD